MLMNVSNFWMLMNVAQTWHKRCTNSVNVQRFVQRLINGLPAIFEFLEFLLLLLLLLLQLLPLLPLLLHYMIY